MNESSGQEKSGAQASGPRNEDPTVKDGGAGDASPTALGSADDLPKPAGDGVAPSAAGDADTPTQPISVPEQNAEPASGETTAPAEPETATARDPSSGERAAPHRSAAAKNSVEDEIDGALDDLFLDPGDHEAKPANLGQASERSEADAEVGTKDAGSDSDSGATSGSPAEEALPSEGNGRASADESIHQESSAQTSPDSVPSGVAGSTEEPPSIGLAAIEPAESSEGEEIPEEEPFEPDPIAILELQLQESQAATQEFRDQLYRKAADLENTRRRLSKQLNDARKYGGDNVLREFLPVLDDLERALEHAQNANQIVAQGDSDKAAPVLSLMDGMNLVIKKFAASLERFGVKGFGSVGEVFNPQLHEAIQQVETEEHATGVIVSEFLRGYMMHGRLLRPALVVVAHNSAAEKGEPEEKEVSPPDEESAEASQEELPVPDQKGEAAVDGSKTETDALAESTEPSSDDAENVSATEDAQAVAAEEAHAPPTTTTVLEEEQVPAAQAETSIASGAIEEPDAEKKPTEG